MLYLGNKAKKKGFSLVNHAKQSKSTQYWLETKIYTLVFSNISFKFGVAGISSVLDEYPINILRVITFYIIRNSILFLDGKSVFREVNAVFKPNFLAFLKKLNMHHRWLLSPK